ncbi:flippase [Priestia megaterium]|uniref:flippase n=1 Tax=Priestia megaterium TaxID=1404 RepID=UPI002220F484|nr:flippase [Priestia megaterium]UYV54093.1 flippase [Priestia megaterium]
MRKDIKKIASNITFLSALQIFNYIMPFLLFPYLTKKLGTNNFGVWMLALSVVQYLNILIDYGFNLSATKRIAIFKNDKEKVNEIFTNVMSVKFLFFAICCCLIIVFNKSINSLLHFPDDLMFEMLFFLLGLIITPFWLFQGLEQLKVPTTLNLLARLFSMIITFILVEKENDLNLLPLINGIPLILTGIISWFILYRREIRMGIPNVNRMKYEIKDGIDLFISSISVTLYTTLNSILLGIVSGPQAVAYYSVCEKIIQAIKSMITPIYQATYPYVSKTLNKKQGFDKKIFNYLIILSTFIGTIILVGLSAFNEFIIGYFFEGEIVTSLKITFTIMSFIPLLTFLNNTLFIQTLVPLGEYKYLRRVTLVAGVINILFVILFTAQLHSVGSSIGYLLAEISVFLLGSIKIYFIGRQTTEREMTNEI